MGMGEEEACGSRRETLARETKLYPPLPVPLHHHHHPLKVRGE
jgi:hypothetical protein